MALISAAILVFSQSHAFAMDEGFHLLTAQLIASGKRPYLDFFFPQTPLNAYWNALWLRIFGENWHVAHAVAALLTIGAIWMTADYVYRFFPVSNWRLPGAVVTMFIIGTNAAVFNFGGVAQAYGICLFLIVCAFRIAVVSVERGGWLIPMSAGFCAAAAPACSLLSAPVAPVLLIWMLIESRAGKRSIKAVAFIAGAAIPALPILWLFMQGPRQVFFDIVQYHTLYRTIEWHGATRHNLEVMTDWIDSSQVLLLLLLTLAGVLFLVENKTWDQRRRSELYLCLWLAGAVSLYVSTAHPTFARYYLLALPFLAILAVVGLYDVGSRLGFAARPLGPALMICVLLSLTLGKWVYEDRDSTHWSDLEAMAKKVDQVTPPQGRIWADEHIFFLTRRPPPMGMESADSHKLPLTPALAAKLHVVPRPELDRQVKAGVFDTVETCADDDKIADLGLDQTYAMKQDFDDCTVYWDRKPHSATALAGHQNQVSSSVTGEHRR